MRGGVSRPILHLDPTQFQFSHRQLAGFADLRGYFTPQTAPSTHLLLGVLRVPLQPAPRLSTADIRQRLRSLVPGGLKVGKG